MSRVRASTLTGGARPRPTLDQNNGGEDVAQDSPEEGSLGLGGGLHRYGGLTDLLSNRPTKEELVQRNILKDDKVSPRLAAAQEELKKKKLEDLLNHKLEHRAPVADLVEHNILKGSPETAPSLLANQESLKRHKIEDEVSKTLRERPPVQELVEKNIIKPSDMPPV